MLTYSDVETYVRDGLTELGYAGSKMPLLHPGPIQIERLQQLSPNSIVFLMVGGGIGLSTEGVYDRPLLTVRAIGSQNDYAEAETLAHDVDRLLLAVVDNVKTIGSSRALYVTRTGGAPQLVNLDAGERYHFQATYITEVPR